MEIKGRCVIIKLPFVEFWKQERGCLWDISLSTLSWWTKKGKLSKQHENDYLKKNDSL